MSDQLICSYNENLYYENRSISSSDQIDLKSSERYDFLQKCLRDFIYSKAGLEMTPHEIQPVEVQAPAVEESFSENAPQPTFMDEGRIDPTRPDAKPVGFLWEIRKADQVAGYFFGSIHLVPNWVLYNMNSETLNALGDCDVLGVEVDIRRAEVGEAMLDKQREMIRLAQKYGIDSGIDQYFIERAEVLQMPVEALESLQTHQSAFSLHEKEGQPLSEEKFVGGLRKAISIYEEGSTQLLEELCSRMSEDVAANTHQRNVELAESTHRLIASGKKPFAVIGAAHFTGEHSMQKCMEEMGYQVQQIVCEEARVNPFAFLFGSMIKT